MPASAGVGLRPLPDLLVGEGDRLAHQAGGVGGAARQPGLKDLQRRLRRDLAAGLAADAVDHGIDAALGVAEHTVLVVLPLAAGIGKLRGQDALGGGHLAPLPGGEDREHGDQGEERDEEGPAGEVEGRHAPAALSKSR